MAIITITFTHYLGGTAIRPEIYPSLLASMRAVFMIFFIISTASLIMAVAAGRRRAR